MSTLETMAGWHRGNDIAPGAGGLIPGPVKSDTVSPTARHRCDISSELEAAEMGPATHYVLRVIRRV